MFEEWVICTQVWPYATLPFMTVENEETIYSSFFLKAKIIQCVLLHSRSAFDLNHSNSSHYCEAGHMLLIYSGRNDSKWDTEISHLSILWSACKHSLHTRRPHQPVFICPKHCQIFGQWAAWRYFPRQEWGNSNQILF